VIDQSEDAPQGDDQQRLVLLVLLLLAEATRSFKNVYQKVVR
jgi:hypothetical protein